jgi:hypothetical protein
MITALIACTTVGTDLFRDLPLLLKKPGQNRAKCPTKEKESESY